jgi:hypothetical protein
MKKLSVQRTTRSELAKFFFKSASIPRPGGRDFLGVTTELVVVPRENRNLTRTGEPRRPVNGNEKAVRPNER